MNGIQETFIAPSRVAAAIDEVNGRLAVASAGVDPKKAAERAHFMKTVLPMLGLTVPVIRKVYRGGFSFEDGPPDEVLAIWFHVWWKANCHEASLLPIYYLETLAPVDDPIWLWQRISPWAKKVSCWDQSDGLSGVYAQLLEQAPEAVYPGLAAWNDSDNPWLRRQSLVSLIYYHRVRQHVLPPEKVLPLVLARLADPDYYVQKGLGWCLREAFQAWPATIETFLESHVGELAPAAWQAATEKLSPDFKQHLKVKRQGLRRSGR